MYAGSIPTSASSIKAPKAQAFGAFLRLLEKAKSVRVLARVLKPPLFRRLGDGPGAAIDALGDALGRVPECPSGRLASDRLRISLAAFGRMSLNWHCLIRTASSCSPASAAFAAASSRAVSHRFRSIGHDTRWPRRLMTRKGDGNSALPRLILSIGVARLLGSPSLSTWIRSFSVLP